MRLVNLFFSTILTFLTTIVSQSSSTAEDKTYIQIVNPSELRKKFTPAGCNLKY